MARPCYVQDCVCLVPDDMHLCTVHRRGPGSRRLQAEALAEVERRDSSRDRYREALDDAVEWIEDYQSVASPIDSNEAAVLEVVKAMMAACAADSS